MKIIAVKGSARDTGISNVLIDELIRGAEKAGHEVKVYNVGNMKLFGCHGCEVCRKTGSFCIRDDELKPYWSDLAEAGALILGAPIYMGQPDGQMMSFMNRHYCLKNADRSLKLTDGKKLVTVYSQGAPQDYSKYLSAQKNYINVFTGNGFVSEAVICAGGDSDIESLKIKAYKIGENL